MEQDARRQAELLMADPDFKRGCAALVQAFAVRWLLAGPGCDVVSVGVGDPGGPVVKLVILASPLAGPGAGTLRAAERALYRAVDVHADTAPRRKQS